jgi:hypothetical protein
LFLVTWITPSARTSVGNKEYEYKGKEERAANLQQPVHRRKTMCFGEAARVVALRHPWTVSDVFAACQQFKLKPFRFDGDFSSGRLAVQMKIDFHTRPHANEVPNPSFQRFVSEAR